MHSALYDLLLCCRATIADDGGPARDRSTGAADRARLLLRIDDEIVAMVRGAADKRPESQGRRRRAGATAKTRL